MISTQIYAAIDSEKKVFGEYIKGNYNTAEGYITGYSTDYDMDGNTRYDYFYVSDVYFTTPGFVSRWGYPLTKETDTQLDNEMYVKIHYVPYKFENVIMYLELLE